MAEQTVIEFVDDIDGSPAQHTIKFALDGVTYEIDLNDRHAQRLRSVLEHHIKYGRRSPVRGDTPSAEREERQVRETNKDLTAQIRGAAQRTREHLSRKATSKQAMRTVQVEQPQITSLEPHVTAEPTKPASVPELAPPQFSSA